MKVLSSVAVSMLVASSCGFDEPPGNERVLTDSAGVRILEFLATGVERPLSDTPAVRIGGFEGGPAHELYNVRSAARGEDGRILVANSGTSEIRVFDAAGRFLRSVGGSGEGPGEFRSLDWVEWGEGGRFVAFDTDLRRISTFGAKGELISTVDVSHGPGFPMPGDLLLPNGHFLVLWEQDDVWPRISAGQVDPGEVVSWSALLLRHNPATRGLDTLTIERGGDLGIITSRGRIGTSAPPFRRAAVYALGEDGIYIGDQHAFEIRKLNFAGELEGVIRGPEYDLSITGEDVALYEEASLEAAPDWVRDDPDSRQRALDEMRNVPLPPSKPAFGRVLVGPPRRLWVSEGTNGRVHPRRWTMVDLDTGETSTLVVPERFYLFQVGEGFLLGRSTDALGVESVLVYELPRTP